MEFLKIASIFPNIPSDLMEEINLLHIELDEEMAFKNSPAKDRKSLNILISHVIKYVFHQF